MKHIEGGLTCGYYCPRCHHCDAKILAHNPVPGVKLELKCVQCEYEWFEEDK